jgi:lipid-A-disaccharide synthase
VGIRNILIIAGESSAENYGAMLIKEFNKLDPNYDFWGTGGDMMQKEGCDILYHIKELSLIGIFEVIFHIKRILNIKKDILKEVDKRKPSLAILIDFPDFNLSLAKQLKKRGIKVIYYISPTVWAWRYNRVKKIKKYIDKILLIFPFETKIYEKEGIDYEFTGHPIFEIVKPQLSEEESVKRFNPEGKIHIILMPGSRKSELKFHTPHMLEAVSLLKKKYKNIKFSLIKASHLNDSYFKKYEKTGVDLYSEYKYSIMKSGDLIISTSGTSNFEAMILKKPVVVIYKVSKPTYIMGKSFIKISNYSIVNILSGKRIIPEIIQNDLTGENIFKKASEFIDNREMVENLMKEYDKILSQFADVKNGSKKAAYIIWKQLKEENNELFKY